MLPGAVISVLTILVIGLVIRPLYQRLFLQLTEDTQLLSKSFGAVQAGQMITKCTAVPQQLFKIVALL